MVLVTDAAALVVVKTKSPITSMSHCGLSEAHCTSQVIDLINRDLAIGHLSALCLLCIGVKDWLTPLSPCGVYGRKRDETKDRKT